MMININNSHFT